MKSFAFKKSLSLLISVGCILIVAIASLVIVPKATEEGLPGIWLQLIWLIAVCLPPIGVLVKIGYSSLPERPNLYRQHLVLIGIHFVLAIATWGLIHEPEWLIVSAPFFLIFGVVEYFRLKELVPSSQLSENTSQTILVITSNPKDSTNLRLGEELRKIRNELRGSTHRDSFNIEFETASTLSQITYAFQKFNAGIVHFSGHGTGHDGLIIETEAGLSQPFSNDALVTLFGNFKDTVQCVVLNACYSKVQAQNISKFNIYVIGMPQAIEDKAAIEFARGFYQSLGEGKDFQFAFNMALVPYRSMQASGEPELWLNGEQVSAGVQIQKGASWGSIR